jgi:hypothetical protein
MRQNFESMCDAWVSLNKTFHHDRAAFWFCATPRRCGGPSGELLRFA